MPLGPVHYGSLLGGGEKMREQLGVPCGLAFSPTLEGNVTLHTILYASRAWILDGHGNVLFNKNAFADRRAQVHSMLLYQQAGTPEQLTWGTGRQCARHAGTQDLLQHQRHQPAAHGGERKPDVAKKMWLQPPLMGANGMGVTGAAARHQLFSSLELCSEPGGSHEICRPTWWTVPGRVTRKV